MVEVADQLTFDGETLRYTPPDKLGWELHKSDVAVVGESTYGGPDRGVEPTYCFVDRAGHLYMVRYQTPGCLLAMVGLSRAMKTNLTFTFQKARPYESRVIWPRRVRGQAMFDYKRQAPRSLLHRVFRGGESVEQVIRPEVQKMIDESRNSRSVAHG